jgi:hypothetical protein
MQKFHSCLLLTALAGLSLTACKSHEKKIIVYASSDITVDESKQHITVADGTTHHEQELDFATGSPVNIDVQSPVAKLTASATDDGLYVLNLKNDTVIGSFQHVGENGEARITQEALKQKLDSLRKLVLDQNVSEANRNYFIVPGKMVKISSDPRAKVFGPFTTIPGSFDAGSVPEIYKFYTVPEIREIIAKLQIMAGGESDNPPAGKKP